MTNLFKYTLLIFLLSFAACSSDDDGAPSVPNGQPQPGDALELTVSAADFMTDGAPGTRATDNGNETTFENGDRVGIIILDADNNPIYDNIPYVYNNVKWTFDSNNGEGKGGCYYDPESTTYIVYYPYSRAADGVTSVDDLKTKFAPKFNQSDIKDYRASDLMVWNSNNHLASSVTTLNAELKHAFSSVSLSPITKYLLDDGANTPCTSFSLKISDVNFTINDVVYIPYQATNGSLRCILPAGFTTGDIRCFYTIGSKTYSNKVSILGATTNTRYTSSPEIIYKTYSLDDAKVGDFYCKNKKNNGYLIPSDATLSDDQKAACVGIVFWVGDATMKDQTLRNDHSSCTHGLVVALKDASDTGIVWQNPTSSVQNWLNTYQKDKYLPVASAGTSGNPLNNIQGYNNTKAIEVFNENIANLNNIVSAVSTVVAYRKAVLAPANSSDWYLPSAKELTLLCGKDIYNIWSSTFGTANRDLINGKLSSISNGATEIQSAFYWPSTESYGDLVFYVSFINTGHIHRYPRSNAYRVRCVLAF